MMVFISKKLIDFRITNKQVQNTNNLNTQSEDTSELSDMSYLIWLLMHLKMCF